MSMGSRAAELLGEANSEVRATGFLDPRMASLEDRARYSYRLRALAVLLQTEARYASRLLGPRPKSIHEL